MSLLKDPIKLQGVVPPDWVNRYGILALMPSPPKPTRWQQFVAWLRGWLP